MVALDAHHSAVACFYGMLSVLQRPLTQFVYARCVEVAAASRARDRVTENAQWKLLHATTRKQLEFLRDHSTTYLRNDELAVVVDDVKTLLQVQSGGFYSPNTTTAVYLDGVAAGARLVAAVSDDAHTIQQAETLQHLLVTADVDPVEEEDGKGVGSDDSEQPDAKRIVDNQVSHTQLNGAKMRKWLMGQSLRIMETMPYEDDVDRFEASKREVVRLLREAMKYTKNYQQQSDILLTRAEFYVTVGEPERAVDDANAALMPMNLRSIDHVKRIANVFLHLGRYDDAARAYDRGLQQYPGNRQLLACKAEYLAGWTEPSNEPTKMGFYQHEMWANADRTDNVQQPTSRSDWSTVQNKLPTETPEESAVGDDDRADTFSSNQEDDGPELLIGSGSQPKSTDVAYAAAECVLDAASLLWVPHDEESQDDSRSLPTTSAHDGRGDGPREPDIWPAGVRDLLHTGLAAFGSKNYQDGERYFTDALAVLDDPSQAQHDPESFDPVRVKLLGHRARSQFAQKKYAAAATDAMAGIRLQPEWVDGYRLVCRAWMGQGRWREAKQACDHVVARVPRDSTFRELQQVLHAKCSERRGREVVSDFKMPPCGTTIPTERKRSRRPTRPTARSGKGGVVRVEN